MEQAPYNPGEQGSDAAAPVIRMEPPVWPATYEVSLDTALPRHLDTTQAGWLGALVTPLVQPPEEPLERLQEPDIPPATKEQSIYWHPYPLEAGWEREVMDFVRVMAEVAAEIALPVEIPRSDLTR